MKCPKCAYIGFEVSDRCRNCGYEFALAVRDESAPLPVRSPGASDGPLEDLVLSSTPLSHERRAPGKPHELDLDRIIGAPESEPDLPLFEGAVARESPDPRRGDPARPLIAPASPRRPLSVRRTTPDASRFRSPAGEPPSRTVRNLELPLPTESPREVEEDRAHEHAEARARLFAALTDAGLLLAIDALVVYFTLRLCSLSVREASLLPLLPLAAFFVLLNGGYLLAFTAATGQTIGKMAFGLKVVGLNGAITPITAAVRSAACLFSALTLGAGLLPGLLGGRSLQDRLAGTAVVHVRE